VRPVLFLQKINKLSLRDKTDCLTTDQFGRSLTSIWSIRPSVFSNLNGMRSKFDD